MPCLNSIFILLFFLGGSCAFAQDSGAINLRWIDAQIAGFTPAIPIDVPTYSNLNVVGMNIQKSQDQTSTDRFQYGEPFTVDLFLKIVDRFAVEKFKMGLSLGGWSETAIVSDLEGGEKYPIGGIIKKTFSIRAVPLPEPTLPLPFFTGHSYPVTFTLWNELGRQSSVSIAELEVAPLADESALCLTGNSDVDPARCENRLVEISFPDGNPIHHTSGNGDIRSELTDGVFSGSGIPEWETVFWTGDWSAKSRRMELQLNRESEISAVVVIFSSPYGDNWIDKLMVEGRQTDGTFVQAGSATGVPGKNQRGLHVLAVRGLRLLTGYLRFTLLQQEGATRIPVSEVYVLGR